MILKYGFLLFMAAQGAPVSAQAEMARPVVLPGETILRVEGIGEISTPPEVMRMSVGVVTTADTAAAALDENSRKIAPVIEILRDAGIMPSDIQTSGLNVEAQFADTSDVDFDRIIGFRAENRIKFTSRDIGQAGELISLLFDAGANEIDGPYFAVAESNIETLSRQAEANALREARAQADATAATLGMKVSRILLISGSNVNFAGDSSGFIVVTARKRTATPIEPGEITVNATYDVEFALVDN